jgi:phenylacetate-CoA ligase
VRRDLIGPSFVAMDGNRQVWFALVDHLDHDLGMAGPRVEGLRLDLHQEPVFDVQPKSIDPGSGVFPLFDADSLNLPRVTRCRRRRTNAVRGGGSTEAGANSRGSEEGDSERDPGEGKPAAQVPKAATVRGVSIRHLRRCTTRPEGRTRVCLTRPARTGGTKDLHKRAESKTRSREGSRRKFQRMSPSSQESRRVELLAQVNERLAGGEVERVNWPLERLEAERDKRLRALVSYAKAHSPWHAERLAHIDTDLLSASALDEVPVMSKSDLMDHWDDIVTDRRLTKRGAQTELARLSAGSDGMFWMNDFVLVETGGSTGDPTVVVWDVEGWVEMAAIVTRYGAWLQQSAASRTENQGPPDRFHWVQATVGSSHPTSMSRQLARFFERPEFENHEIPANSPIAEAAAALRQLNPSGLFGFASALIAVADEVKQGRLSLTPAMVGASSEPLTEQMRSFLLEQFGTEPSNTYAVTELGAMAARTAPGGSDLCLVEDAAVYEPVINRGDGTHESTMERVSDGLIVTNVLNRAMPLIRYHLPDRVLIEDPVADAPWSGRRITVVGPRPPALTYAVPGHDPVIVDPTPIQDAVSSHPLVLDYSLVQTAEGIEISVWLGSESPDLRELKERCRTQLAAAGLEQPAVEVVCVEDPGELPRTPAGKRRHLIPFSPT